MGTKIIVDKRRTGKTTKAIEESARTSKYILVPNRVMAKCIFKQALDMGIDILFPVTIDEVLNKHVVALYTSAWIEICGTIGT